MSHNPDPREAFLKEINTYQPLERAAASQLYNLLRIREYNRKEILLLPGQVNQRLHFVCTGLLRGYHIRPGEQDKEDKSTSLFAAESCFIISPPSFLKQRPSHEGFEMLEDSVLVWLSYEDLYSVYGTFPSANAIRAQVTERYLLYYTGRDEAFRYSTGEKRYRWLLTVRPELGRGRIAYKYIASFSSCR